jgi:hypothetical protein
MTILIVVCDLGKYICIGDDGNEKLEFEMTLHVSNDRKINKMNILYFIIM